MGGTRARRALATRSGPHGCRVALTSATAREAPGRRRRRIASALSWSALRSATRSALPAMVSATAPTMRGMDAESLLALVRVHAWANDRILTTAEALTDDDFRRLAPLNHGSVFTTLRHLADVTGAGASSASGTMSQDVRVGPRVRPRRPPEHPRLLREEDAACGRTLRVSMAQR